MFLFRGGMPVLDVRNLSKVFYSGFWPWQKRVDHVAVNNISFSLKEGEILGFLGSNGAGKTTTIQMLLGTLTPTSGLIYYLGKEFSAHRKESLMSISYASGYDALPGRLTVWENLDIIGRIYGLPHIERAAHIEHLLKTFGMWNMRNKETGTLSAGQATRIMLVKAFLARPRILLLDEPTASLDPDIAHEVRKFIMENNKETGVSVLLTSHNMDEVTKICSRALVLKQGAIIADDTPEKLAKSISSTHIHLMVSDGLLVLVQYLEQRSIRYKMQEPMIKIAVDEQAIASFLTDLAEKKIVYSHISIEKATLEDYFLSIAK
jgi:ABC-2 type transport system ATP-binding protein